MENNKICSFCKISKDISEFAKRRGECKPCQLAKGRERDRNRYQGRKEAMLAQKKQHYAENTEVYKERNHNYHAEHKGDILERKKVYYQLNKEQIIANYRIRYNTDDNFKLMCCIRRRTREFMKGIEKYIDIIGCSPEYLNKWFTYNFGLDSEMNMNMTNFGEWQIDHVYPLSLAMKLPENDREQYFRWTNLRPVSRNYNAVKHNKLIQNDLDLIEERIADFIEINPLEDFNYKKIDNIDEFDVDYDIVVALDTADL